MPPVFIVGCSRTGSTLLQDLLNRYTSIDILPEAHFLVPIFVHKDFATAMLPYKGLDDETFVEKVMLLMSSGRLFGVFWEKEYPINFDTTYLREALLSSEKNIKGVLSAVMKTHARANGKISVGAKFPVYICYAHKLKEWFEEGLIVHTIMDPRAIFASQYYKRRSREGNFLKKIIVAIIQFVHINIQFFWAFQTHRKFNGKKGYFCCKYEDLVQYPEETVRSLCKFLSIPFDPRMLQPHAVLNTSFLSAREVTKSFQTSSVYAWKYRIPKVVSKLIALLHISAMREFGYRQ